MKRRDELIAIMQEALDAERPLDAAVLAEIERDAELRRLHADLRAMHEAIAAGSEAAMPDGLAQRIAARVAREPLPRHRRSPIPAVAAIAAFAAALAAVLLLRAPSPPTPNVPTPMPHGAIASVPLPTLRLEGKLARHGEAVRRAGAQPFVSAGNFLAGLGRLVTPAPGEEPARTPTSEESRGPS